MGGVWLSRLEAAVSRRSPGARAAAADALSSPRPVAKANLPERVAEGEGQSRAVTGAALDLGVKGLHFPKLSRKVRLADLSRLFYFLCSASRILIANMSQVSFHRDLACYPSFLHSPLLGLHPMALNRPVG